MILERLALAALGVLAVAFGLGDIAPLTPAATVVLRSLQLLPLLVLSLVLLACVARPKLVWLPWRVALPVLVWLGVLLCSALLAPTHRTDALAAVGRSLTGALLAWSVLLLARPPGRRLALLRALGLGGLAVGLVGLAEALQAPGMQELLAAIHAAPVPVGDVPRVSSTLSHPNVAAVVLELTLPLLVAWAWTARPVWRLPLWLAAAASLAALVLTFSRAGIIAGLGSLALLVVIAMLRGELRLAGIGLGAIITVVATLAWAAASNPDVQRRVAAELDHDIYSVAYVAPPRQSVSPARALVVPVRLTNLSDAAWPASGWRRVALGYHLLRADGTPVDFECVGSLLPSDVPPNASLELLAHIQAPSTPGSYRVEWDAVREGIAWFSWRGSPTAQTELIVEPGGPGDDRTGAAGGGTPVRLPQPSRVQFWSVAWAMFWSQPLLGVGPDNFRWRFGDFSGVPVTNVGVHAHDQFLETLADSGGVGLLAFGWLLMSLLRQAARGLLVDASWVWRAAVLASLSAWLAHALLDDFERFWPASVAFWLLAGLGALEPTAGLDGAGAGDEQRADGGHGRVLDHRRVVGEQVVEDGSLGGILVAAVVRVDSPLQRDGQETATQRARAGGAPCGHDCIEHGQTINASGSTSA
jgi:hypothetical protein